MGMKTDRIATTAAGLKYVVVSVNFETNVVSTWGELASYRAKQDRLTGEITTVSRKFEDTKSFKLDDVTLSHEVPTASSLDAAMKQGRRARSARILTNELYAV